MKKEVLYGILFILLFGACEKWYQTDEVSHISELPQFTLLGDEFMSVVRSDSLEYEEPGATAHANGKELNVRIAGGVDLSEVGVYLVRYYAVNADGLENTADRIVAVTHEDVAGNDLSGTYEGTNWELQEMKVTREHSKGLYKCEEVLGYYSQEVKGSFVDIGDNELVLLPGDGDLGRYGADDGTYSLSTLSWTVKLLDKPNDGVEITVLWRKQL